MTTAYYTFQTRKVKVSGGPDLLSLVPVAHTEAQAAQDDGKVLTPKDFGGSIPQAGTQEAPKAEILDFSLCRKHMETRNAWKALARAAEEEEQPGEPGDGDEFLDTRWAPVEGAEESLEPQGAPGKWQVSERLELIASGAVILTALSAAAAFLSLL